MTLFNNLKRLCLFLFVALFLKHSIFFAQDTIINNYKIKQDSLIKTLLNSYENKTKYKWLNLMPSLSYDIKNNTVNIGFSLTGLSNYFQQRQRNKIQLEQLKVRLVERLEKKTNTLELEIQAFKVEKEALKNSIQLFKTTQELYAITKGKYSNNEISTKDFLTHKKSYLKELNSLKNSLYKLQTKALKLFQKTKSKAFKSATTTLLAQVIAFEDSG